MPALAKRGAIIEAGARKILSHSAPGQHCFDRARVYCKNMKYKLKNAKADALTDADEHTA